MKIIVDRDVCISAADCVLQAGGTFELDDEGKVRIKDTATWDDKQKILEAAKACPVACIYVYDDDGTQLWPEQGGPAPAAMGTAKSNTK